MAEATRKSKYQTSPSTVLRLAVQILDKSTRPISRIGEDHGPHRLSTFADDLSRVSELDNCMKAIGWNEVCSLFLPLSKPQLQDN